MSPEDERTPTMKYKELIAKYKGYQVIRKGYPNTAPFAFMPKELNGLHGKAYERVLNELEVKGYKVVENPSATIDITSLVLGGKKRPNNTNKGTLFVYLVSDKPL